ncbi:DUF4426 domain-containing protein [Spongiibacter sp. KMU-158]|uniref:DUF4426 domain-containing protein n=1 Tax=Spongiibacter pelagi TaxID=2760804 RepID=A0A927C024_9GAMM|nr:DUF4426 domain-containing protein [Spongiibacter pelagi]MBD2857397.1 DUF4426 domain-containing protein [Spongiibacter pelagi]
MPRRLIPFFLALSLLGGLSQSAFAQDIVQPQTSDGESSRQFGPDTIHYSVLNTRFLSAQVAQAYGITRGDNKFLLNIAVRHQGEASEHAIKAKISGTSSDLIYQTPLKFREVVEQDAIYYLAEFEVRSEERLSFRLQVQTATRPMPYDLQFNKMLYPAKDGM